MAALTTATWPKAIAEMFRVTTPGGWVELLDAACNPLNMGVGPHSNKVNELVQRLFVDKGSILDLHVQLPLLLRTAGFVKITLDIRSLPANHSVRDGVNHAELMYDLWVGMKGPMLAKGGHGIVQSGDEFDDMMKGAQEEWKGSEDANFRYFTVYAQKP